MKIIHKTLHEPKKVLLLKCYPKHSHFHIIVFQGYLTLQTENTRATTSDLKKEIINNTAKKCSIAGYSCSRQYGSRYYTSDINSSYLDRSLILRGVTEMKFLAERK